MIALFDSLFCKKLFNNNKLYPKLTIKKLKIIFNFIENSLYASDSSVGALDTLRMELYLTSDKYCVKDGHFMHGSILTENLFKGMIFDIIVSAPPHMRQELFSQQQPFYDL